MQEIAATASDGPHKPSQSCAIDQTCLEITALIDYAMTVARRSGIDPKNRPKLAGAIAANQCGMAPRPGLEPGTCGLTVRPVIARKAAPVNDLGQNDR
jgi:hypothetical protein